MASLAPPAPSDRVRLLALLVETRLDRSAMLKTCAKVQAWSDLGLASLEVIIVLIHHMESCGRDSGDFSLGWVGLFDSVSGIVEVITMIETGALVYG